MFLPSKLCGGTDRLPTLVVASDAEIPNHSVSVRVTVAEEDDHFLRPRRPEYRE